MTIPGGIFYRGYDGVGHDDMRYEATVSTFVLDRYEVTVGRFRAFVNAGMGTLAMAPGAGAGAHPSLAGSGWDSAWSTELKADTSSLAGELLCNSTYGTWTVSAGANENKPMNCVTWYEAMAFCIWDGGYLPTEAEWSYAASGGSDHRAYPWSRNPATSTTIDCTYANYKIDTPAGMLCDNGTISVGSKSPIGDGRWEHSDLAGNVGEWTLDWYASPYPTPCDDCANLMKAGARVHRGGGFYDVASDLRVAGRGTGIPSARSSKIGFRCARTP